MNLPRPRASARIPPRSRGFSIPTTPRFWRRRSTRPSPPRPPRPSERKWSSFPTPASIIPAPSRPGAARARSDAAACAASSSSAPITACRCAASPSTPPRPGRPRSASRRSPSEALRSILPLEGVAVDARPFEGEHSLEMPLIFLQRLIPSSRSRRCWSATRRPNSSRRCCAACGAGRRRRSAFPPTCRIFSPASAARAKDAETRSLIEGGRWSELGPANACGFASLRGAIRRAQSLRMRATGLAFATSDRGGRPEGARRRLRRLRVRVSGRGAARKTDQDRLVAVASASLDFAASRGGATPEIVADPNLPPSLTAHRAAFATLERGAALRGCIGSLFPHRPLAGDVGVNAVKAGFGDPRFAPLTRAELPI